MNWIPIKEKLPPEPSSLSEWKSYLTCDEYGCDIGIYRGFGNWSSLIHETRMLKVTHWLEHPKLT